MKQNKTLFLVEIAIFTALGYVLHLASDFIFSRIWPQGGSISIEMVPIFLMAFRWGLKGGLLTGLLLGVLQGILGGYIIHPVQGLMDYPVAYAVVGLAGIFASKVKDAVTGHHRGKWMLYVALGILIGSFLRFVSHVISGIVFFSQGEAAVPALKISLIYNGTYMLPSFILSAIVVILVISAAPKRMIR